MGKLYSPLLYKLFFILAWFFGVLRLIGLGLQLYSLQADFFLERYPVVYNVLGWGFILFAWLAISQRTCKHCKKRVTSRILFSSDETLVCPHCGKLFWINEEKHK